MFSLRASIRGGIIIRIYSLGRLNAFSTVIILQFFETDDTDKVQRDPFSDARLGSWLAMYGRFQTSGSPRLVGCPVV